MIRLIMVCLVAVFAQRGLALEKQATQLPPDVNADSRAAVAVDMHRDLAAALGIAEQDPSFGRRTFRTEELNSDEGVSGDTEFSLIPATKPKN